MNPRIQMLWDLADSISRKLREEFGVEFIADGSGSADCTYRHENGSIPGDAKFIKAMRWARDCPTVSSQDDAHILLAFVSAHAYLMDDYIHFNSRIQ